MSRYGLRLLIRRRKDFKNAVWLPDKPVSAHAQRTNHPVVFRESESRSAHIVYHVRSWTNDKEQTLTRETDDCDGLRDAQTSRCVPVSPITGGNSSDIFQAIFFWCCVQNSNQKCVQFLCGNFPLTPIDRQAAFSDCRKRHKRRCRRQRERRGTGANRLHVLDFALGGGLHHVVGDCFHGAFHLDAGVFRRHQRRRRRRRLGRTRLLAAHINHRAFVARVRRRLARAGRARLRCRLAPAARRIARRARIAAALAARVVRRTRGSRRVWRRRWRWRWRRRQRRRRAPLNHALFGAHNIANHSINANVAASNLCNHTPQPQQSKPTTQTKKCPKTHPKTHPTNPHKKNRKYRGLHNCGDQPLTVL